MDQIVLSNSDGEILDNVIYGPQLEGLSEGRTGGDAAVQQFVLPTPGTAQPQEGTDEYIEYNRILGILSSLRITEIMYNPLGGSDYEYIELKNIGDSDINLNGVQFVNGIEYEFGDVSLMPNETVVLVSNIEAFTSRYGELKYLADQ